MASNKQIIQKLGPREFANTLTALLSEKKTIIIKFTADWCGPCKRIKNDCYSMFNQLPDNIVVADLNVDLDHNSEFYSLMKRKRMVNGIPVLMAWFPLAGRDFWYVPDDSVTGGDINAIKDFLQRVYQRAVSI